MNYLNRLFPALVVLLMMANAGQAQSCDRHIEAEGGFSICLPDGWVVESRQGDKYKTLFGEAADNFRPNINFRVDTSSAPLSKFVDDGVALILASKEQLGVSSIELTGRSDFRTDAGLAGIRINLRSDYKGFIIRTIQYYFDDDHGRKLMVTCTSLEKNKEVFDPIFERAAKSFRIG